MKHKKFITAALALLGALSLAGCGSAHTEQAGNKASAESQNESQNGSLNESQNGSQNKNQNGSLNESPNESQTGNEGADTSADNDENPTNLDNLLDTALLRGSVADFWDGSFAVVPDQDDGQTVIAAAPGMEDISESTTVSYDGDCIFQIANIDSSAGTVELEAAASSDIKKSTSVYVYGETQDNGEIRASKVLIPRYQ